MKLLTKVLIVTQTVTLAVLVFALMKAYGPPSEEEMKKSRFYAEGKSYGLLIRNPANSAAFKTCTEALEYAPKHDWKGDLTNVTDDDKEAFLAGCKAQLVGS
ncbi:hypothetical protein Ssi03_12990 [Sphaerisporangium siamense]|uniref:Uncharacterized protein n=1 Tax=Sphaerisporangium siamense TaxID=795645 RepID=A0A7W7D9V3_9ACTN|nr:hypothetical protein [Sphaerisporangium siamense]MBB4702932.1 hypothetical protein [Sphaerisporangium siamense]GII83309.1 hypothetical protein Ssi03_12990 [Sphaerisporangium siamense]